MDKNLVRKLIKERHLEYANHLKQFSDLVSKNLALLLAELNSTKMNHGFTLGGFSSLGDEPLWWLSIDWGVVKKLALVHMHDEVKLSYYELDKEKLIQRKTSLKLEEKKQIVVPDVLLIPGVAFDKNYNRLGRGKGYFDSYLKDYKGIKIGIFFSYQEINNIPVEAHDEKLDFIVTDKHIIRRGKNI